MKNLIGVMAILSSLYFPTRIFAETIVLKWGEKIDAKIIEKTDDYIKIEWGGSSLDLRIEDIESIDGKTPSLSQDIYAPPSTKTPKEIFQNISPAVVYITTQRIAAGVQELGSGFIVDREGVVVTNYHVIQTGKDINVKLNDGKSYPVTGIIHYDKDADFCILKVNAQNLPTILLGNSNAIQVGEKVYCLGNPLGLEFSFTDGMLSGTRDLNNVKWLQFTAPIAPGNSGGPLVNTQGEVIGIVTRLSRGFNFALAINEIKSYINTTPKMSLKEFADSVSQADVYILQGDSYTLQKNYTQSISAYKKAIEMNPNDANAYAKLGLVYTLSGQYHQAINYLEKAIQIDPNCVDAYVDLGKTYESLGQYQQAVNYLEKAIQIDPNCVDAHVGLGFVYLTLGQPQQALSNFQKAIQIDPKNAEAHLNLAAVYLLLGQFPQVISHAEKVIQIEPNNVRAYSALGVGYGSLGQYQQAINYLEKAIQIDPNNAETQTNLGGVYYISGQTQKAIIYYQKAIKIDPSNADTYVGIGRTYSDLGQYTQARENFQKAKELFQRKGIQDRINYLKLQQVEELLNQLP